MLPTSADEPAHFTSDGWPRSSSEAVQSRLLARIAYNYQRTILQLEFHGGMVYQYFQVPHQTYQDLLQADSKGAYFNRRIRNVFRCARLAAR